MPERIQLQRRKGWRMPPDTVIVDRRSKWGNPFKAGMKVICPGRYGTIGSPYDGCLNVGAYTNAAHPGTGDYEIRLVRDTAGAVALFGDWVMHVPGMAEDARRELAGKNLGCWCRIGDPCHAEFLLSLANDMDPEVPGE